MFFIFQVINGTDLFQVRSLTLNPIKGILYWSSVKNDINIIEQSRMDGSDRSTLVGQRDQPLLHSPASKNKLIREKFQEIKQHFFVGLVYDLTTDRLYWVNVESNSVQFYEFKTRNIVTILVRDSNGRPTSVVPYDGLIYYADQEDQAIHKADMSTGKNDTVLRNNTGKNIFNVRKVCGT